MDGPLVLVRAIELHRRLDAKGIAHAIGGAIALAYHVGNARATNDIDLNVTADPGHPESVLGVLPAGIDVTVEDAAAIRRDGQVRLWWRTSDGPETPVDLFFPQHELHAVVALRSETVPMLDDRVPILSATDLTIFKALFDRRRDWADIEEMVRAGRVDLPEVSRWLTEIVGAGDERMVRLEAIVAEVADEVDRGEEPDRPTFRSATQRPRSS